MQDKEIVVKNYSLYDTVEFTNWSNRNGLILEEQFFFNGYIFRLCKTIRILDLGTGNGRFLNILVKKGFKNLYGIDLAGNLLLIARERLINYPFIKFDEMSASDLRFGSNTFDLVIGLQQIISFIENKNDRIKALNECHRVLKPKSLFVASFLQYEGRWYNPIISGLTLPIKIYKRDLRFLEYRYLPWLKLDYKINFRFLYNKQPYLYWFKKTEVISLLESVGFKILEVKTSKMIFEDTNEFKNGGMIYIVAEK